MKRRNKILILAAAILMLVCLCCAAAAEGAGSGKLVILLKNMKDKEDLAEVRLAIYRIGSEDGAGGWTLDSGFADSGFLEAKSTREIQAAVKKIRATVESSGMKPVREIQAESNGHFTFSSLPRGIYFGMATAQPERVQVQDFVVAIPEESGSASGLNVEAQLKYSLEPTSAPTPTVTPTQVPTPTPFVTPTPTPVPSETPAPTPETSDTPSPTPELSETPPPVVPPTPTPTPMLTPKPSPKPDPQPHTLTIYYIYWDGRKAAETHYSIHWPGENYDVVSPVIPGYRATLLRVAGVMPNRDLEFTVVYWPPEDTLIEDYETALGLGIIYMHVGVCYE